MEENGDGIQIKKLNDVLVQSNGIIRNEKRMIIGRLLNNIYEDLEETAPSGTKEIHYYYFTNWAKHPLKYFIKIWFLWWTTDHLRDTYNEFQIRFLGFTLRFREWKT
jgi:hypothetical protein